MDGTILGSGSFLAAASGGAIIPTTVLIPSAADWMIVRNFTQSGAVGADTHGINYFWYFGMAAGSAMAQYFTTAGGQTLFQDNLAAGGFTPLNTSTGPLLGTRNALTAITAANPPVVTTAVALPAVGSIVKLTNLNNQPQISGLDFTVTANGGGTFTIGNINLANSVASTAGFWRQVTVESAFYPRRRSLTYIGTRATAAGNQAVIYLSVTHNFAVGQDVRLIFQGGTQVWRNFAALNNVLATITAVNVARAGNEPNNGGTANNIQVNIDVTALGNWNTFGAGNNQSYPDATLVPITPAQVVPVGEDSPTSLSSPLAQTPLDFFGNPLIGVNNGLLSDATVNTGFLGMLLGTGGTTTGAAVAIAGPAGVAANDVMYWVAGKSAFGGQ